MGTSRPPVLTGLVVADLASALEVIGAVALLATLIGLGVAVFVWARFWRQRPDEATTEEQLESYQYMLDEGLIDPQEFERIRARLRQTPDAAGATLAPTPEPPPTGMTGIRAGQPPQPTDFRAGPPAPPAPEPPSDF
jgi:uncharacterized membrane protein YccC